MELHSHDIMGVITVKGYVGSTSAFYQVEDGIIMKSLYPSIAKRDTYKLIAKKKILERLGEHPRIIKYIKYSLEVRSILI